MTATMKLCPYCAEEIKDEAIKCKHCGTWLAPPPGACGAAPDHADPYFHTGFAPPHRLARSTTDAMWAGVLGGLGRYLGVDATWLRIVYTLVTIFTGIVPGLIIYFVLSLIIPAEGQGKP